jgi:threonine aldolase
MARLVEDHANARLIADRLAKSPRIAIDLATVQTNILVFGLAADAPDAMVLVAKARELGVLINAFGPRTLRVVTHLDVSRDQCARAADVLVELAGGAAA